MRLPAWSADSFLPGRRRTVPTRNFGEALCAGDYDTPIAQSGCRDHRCLHRHADLRAEVATTHQPSTFANISGAPIVASDSMTYFGLHTELAPCDLLVRHGAGVVSKNPIDASHLKIRVAAVCRCATRLPNLRSRRCSSLGTCRPRRAFDERASNPRGTPTAWGCRRSQ